MDHFSFHFLHIWTFGTVVSSLMANEAYRMVLISFLFLITRINNIDIFKFIEFKKNLSFFPPFHVDTWSCNVLFHCIQNKYHDPFCWFKLRNATSKVSFFIDLNVSSLFDGVDGSSFLSSNGEDHTSSLIVSMIHSWSPCSTSSFVIISKVKYWSSSFCGTQDSLITSFTLCSTLSWIWLVVLVLNFHDKERSFPKDSLHFYNL